MNILVLLRVGRDPASFTVNRKAERIFVHRDEWRTAPADLNALEAALVLGDAGHMVMAVAIGGAEAAVALRAARAMGAARAVWVQDDALRDIDAGPMVAVVQRVIEHIGGAGLVLMGAEVPHADLAQVAARLAAAQGWAFVEEDAHAVQVEPAGTALTVTVAAGQGFHSVQTNEPAVVAVVEDANKPRYAPAANIVRVYNDPGAVERVSTTDLGLAEEALARLVTRRGERYPPERVFGQVVDGSTEEVARQLLRALRA